jgi:hypothetical protein
MAGVSPGQIINRARDSRPIRSATHPASGNYTQSICIRRHPRNESDQFQSCNLLVAALGIDWKGRLLYRKPKAVARYANVDGRSEVMAR